MRKILHRMRLQGLRVRMIWKERALIRKNREQGMPLQVWVRERMVWNQGWVHHRKLVQSELHNFDVLKPQCCPHHEEFGEFE